MKTIQLNTAHLALRPGTRPEKPLPEVKRLNFGIDINSGSRFNRAGEFRRQQQALQKSPLAPTPYLPDATGIPAMVIFPKGTKSLTDQEAKAAFETLYEQAQDAMRSWLGPNLSERYDQLLQISQEAARTNALDQDQKMKLNTAFHGLQTMKKNMPDMSETNRTEAMKVIEHFVQELMGAPLFNKYARKQGYRRLN